MKTIRQAYKNNLNNKPNYNLQNNNDNFSSALIVFAAVITSILVLLISIHYKQVLTKEFIILSTMYYVEIFVILYIIFDIKNEILAISKIACLDNLFYLINIAIIYRHA